MNGKNASFIVLIALLVIPLVFANPITIVVMESQDEVEAGSVAEFTVKITNDGLDRDVFSIEPDEFNVYPFSDFAQRIEAKPSQVKLDAGESAIVKILIKTIDVTLPNKYYDSKIIVSSVIHPESKESIMLKTYVASAKNIIEIVPRLVQQITPGKEINVPIKLKNRSRLVMDLEVTLGTDIPNIAEPLRVSLRSQEEKQVEMKINVDPTALPGERKITIAAYEKDQLRGSFITEVSILPKDRVEEDRDVKRGFLSSTTTIIRENKGNVASEQRVEAKYNIIQRIFSSMTPKPETEIGKVIWKFTLQPGSKKTIEIYSNYRPLLYGIIAVIIFTAIVLFSIERSVVIKKRTFRGKEMVEGVKEYKIFILVRNGKKYTLSDVKVMDLVPNILNLTSDFGSLRPDRVQHSDRATRLLWNVIKLEPREERVFSYKIRLKDSIVGEVVLPVAIIQFVDAKDKFEQVQSMRVILG